MAEGGTGPTSIQCGYCLVKDDQMNDPRVLPCSHVFCTSCMIGQYRDVGAVTCPICSTTFEGDVNSLPQGVIQTSTQLCDACVKVDGSEHPAVVFCTFCSKKLCKEHQRFHDMVNAEHPTLSIGAFKTEEHKLTVRYCSEHGAKRYSLGCQVCRKVLCLKCVSSTNLCGNGKHHELIHLDELTTTFKRVFGKRCEDVVANEEKISKLYKEFTEMVSEYQVETGEMVSLLHTTRDEQIQAITTKYKLLEEELLRSRMKVQKQMETFMEEEVNSVLSALSNRRKRIEDKFRDRHQVDVVLEHEGTLAKLKALADRQVEDCKVQHVKLSSNPGSKREPEICLVADFELNIGYRMGGLAKLFALPNSVKFSKSVNIPSFCRSICYADGSIYVGTAQNSIEIVDNHFNVKRLTSTPACLDWVDFHCSKVYSSSNDYCGNRTISSYDDFGQILSSWKHTDKCLYNRSAVISGQLAVPDSSNKRITIYSLSGELIKHITGLNLSREGSAIIAVDNNSVVVTCYNESSIFKVNIETGETMWTCRDVSKPHGVAVYNKEYVCVVSKGKLSFINIATGAVEKIISESRIGGSDSGYRSNIEIFDTIAVVSAANHGLNFFDFSP